MFGPRRKSLLQWMVGARARPACAKWLGRMAWEVGSMDVLNPGMDGVRHA